MPTVRRADPTDAARLATLAERTFRSAFGSLNTRKNMDAHCANAYGASIQASEIANPEIETLACGDGVELVGYAQLRWGTAPPCVPALGPSEIKRIYVDQQWHGKGIPTINAEANVNIDAHVLNEHNRHMVSLTTDGVSHSLSVASRSSGYGSSANGGELLCLAVATCYCNDIYREAAKRNISVLRVEVTARAKFGQSGGPARSLSYRARVAARASESAIRDLMLHTDRLAEVQNTLRQGMDVRLEAVEAQSSTEP